MSTRNPKHQAPKAKGGTYWLCGVHAVRAALQNPRREVRRILATANARDRLMGVHQPSRHPAIAETDPKSLEKLLPEGSVHQGVAAEVLPLPELSLHDVLQAGEGPLVLLDQVTDPHNIGAILRSAAAFGAKAVVTTERGAPGETATLAKSASGALETVPLIYVTNLAQALEHIKKAGFWVAGLDGEAKQALHEAKLDSKTALVMGAEGKGLRRLTAERCDLLVKLPMAPGMESLNVSNAAAVALYELYRR